MVTKGMISVSLTAELWPAPTTCVSYIEQTEGKPPAIGTLCTWERATSPDTPRRTRVVVEAAG